MPLSTSETGNACFFEQTNQLLCRLEGANRLLVELQLMGRGTSVYEFNVGGFGQLHRRMLVGAVGARMDQLSGFNQELVDHVVRLGPKNTEALIDVLCKSQVLRTDQIGEAQRKELALFAAVQAFGEKYHVAEIFGHVEGAKVNDPFSIAVYNNMSPAVRHVVGKLTIAE